LNLERNKLRRFPKDLPDSLRVLKLNYNEITSIPENLPENLVFLGISNNKVRTVCLSKRTNLIQCVNLTDNQLIHSIRDQQTKRSIQWASSILEGDNWTTDEYQMCAKQIQKYYRRFRLKKIVRTWRNLSKIKEELLASAMHPSRAGHYENISPEWGLWGC
jgi:Leucine-rich repeat (LRR) protein